MISLDTIAASQALVLGPVLALAGARKFSISSNASDVRGTSIGFAVKQWFKPRSPDVILWAFRFLGVIDVTLGVGLLIGGDSAAIAGLGVLYCLAILTFLVWADRFLPSMPCGCFSATTRTGNRGKVRSIVLCASSLLLLSGSMVGWTWSDIRPGLVIAIAAGEYCLLIGLSPEAGQWCSSVYELVESLTSRRRRRTPFRLLVVANHIERLQFWQDVVVPACAPGGPKMVDHWRDESWQMFEYADGRCNGLTIVAGWYIHANPRRVRVVLARESDTQGLVIAGWDSHVAARHHETIERPQNIGQIGD